MTDGEEERGFTVSDRRGRTSEPERKQTASPGPPPPTNATEERSERAIGPVEFSGFLLSLGSTAMIHLGEAMPDGRTAPVNLPRAQEMIDLLALLEEKTRGNLNPAESSLLTDLLYTLRLRYVDKAR